MVAFAMVAFTVVPAKARRNKKSRNVVRMLETIAPKIVDGTESRVKHQSTMLRWVWIALMAVGTGNAALPAAGARAGVGTGGYAATDAAPAAFNSVERIMNAAVERGTIPGGVVLVGHEGKVVYRKAFGMRSLEPVREAMTVDTIFDLASMTKCIATATSVMKLVQEGKLRLNDPVAAYLPEFAKNGKENITLRQLLTHFSGLREDLDLKAHWRGRDAAYRMAMEAQPAFPPGSRFLYSDINFETLGFVVEKVSGMSLDGYAARNIFEPLGMKDTSFLPPGNPLLKQWRPRIAPTEYGEGHEMMRGTVHDPTAERMGGVAGHAGLFSTADDLSKFAQEMLGGYHVLSALTVEKMSTPQQPPTASVLRGLGWDIDSPFSSNRGEFFPVGSFGHTGFTGTSIWIDPVTNSYVIVLTNAVHPKGSHTAAVVSLRGRIASSVAQAVTGELGLTVSEEQRLRLARITGYNEAMAAGRLVTARNGAVHTGIDVLESHDFATLREEAGAGRAGITRVALVTNQTGVDGQGHRTIDVLAQARARGIELAAIFSPEHGVNGNQDTTAIGDSKDAATGVPVYSVYGDSDAKRRPSPQVLQSVDEIVFDIQDIGTRFYTYETTLGYFLEAAAKAGKKIFVLDRPNPINGVSVQGPVSDRGRESFTNYGEIPVRHGMTIGELARYYNAERGINARLTVVAMEGWERGDWLDSTGVLWVNPSPNMRSLTEAALYPGVGLVEGTNVSVGRGTDTPFELVGAPWIQAVELAGYLNGRAIGGVRFVATEFTPGADVYAQKKCGGVNIVVTDRNALDAPELGVEIASALHTLYPAQFEMKNLDKLMVNQAAAAAIGAGQDSRRVGMDWGGALEAFRAARGKYLLY
jgi:uncharacterized protein YbbC (DUF1343 family)/CubicO group peptidase (beta-lactamase class C family)